jgi:hypothetical protein
MKLTPIEEAFRSVALIHGGVYLLRPVDALRVVDQYRAAGIPILGIDGFRVFDDGTIQPHQEHSVDFGVENATTHEQAKRFLEERLNQEFWFEVVTADR